MPREPSPVVAERARLFAALELPKDVRAALHQWRADRLGKLSALRPTSIEALHVTLCFLGSQPVDEIDAIARACAGCADMGRPVLALGEPVWLPPRRPRVLAVGLEDRQGTLARLQAELARALQDGGWYEPESRPFRAHVTVGRASRGSTLRPLEVPFPAPMSFVGSTIALMRSRLGGTGARYERLAEVPLALPALDVS